MRSTIIAFGFFSFLIAGCASPSSTYTASISPSFSEEEQAAIINAFVAWEKATAKTSKPLHFEIYIRDGECSSDNGLSGAEHSICIFSSTREKNIEIAAAAGENITSVNNLGYTHYNPMLDSATTWMATDRFLIDPDHDIGDFQGVSEHEIGHAFGLSHIASDIKEPDYPIMAPIHYHGFNSITADKDVSQYLETR
jgi:hypothetical protein